MKAVFAKGEVKNVSKIDWTSLLEWPDRSCLLLYVSAHPLKHSLDETIFVSRVQKNSEKKSLLAENWLSGLNRNLHSDHILQDSAPQPLPTTSSRTRTTHQMQ